MSSSSACAASSGIKHKQGDLAQQNLFPVRLFSMLQQLEQDNMTHIVGWQQHGRSFLVRNRDLFVNCVLPKFFKQSRFSSFQRQLNFYGFQRITKGQDAGAYYHEHFQRNRVHLLPKIDRIQCKGVGKGRHRRPVELEPNFYSQDCPAPERVEGGNGVGVLMQPLQEGLSSAVSWKSFQHITNMSPSASAEPTSVPLPASVNTSLDRMVSQSQNSGGRPMALLPRTEAVMAGGVTWSGGIPHATALQSASPGNVGNRNSHKPDLSWKEQNMAMFNLIMNNHGSSTSTSWDMTDTTSGGADDSVSVTTITALSSSDHTTNGMRPNGMIATKMMMNDHSNSGNAVVAQPPQQQCSLGVLNRMLVNGRGNTPNLHMLGNLTEQVQLQQLCAADSMQQENWGIGESPREMAGQQTTNISVAPSLIAGIGQQVPAAQGSSMDHANSIGHYPHHPQQWNNCALLYQQQPGHHPQGQQNNKGGYHNRLPSDLEPRHFAPFKSQH